MLILLNGQIVGSVIIDGEKVLKICAKIKSRDLPTRKDVWVCKKKQCFKNEFLRAGRG